MSIPGGQRETIQARKLQRYGRSRVNSSLDHSSVQATPYGAHTQDEQIKARVLEAEISIAVNPVALITTECITVTSAMRKHTRWAQSSVSAILGGGGPLSNPRESSRGSRQSDKHLAPSAQHGRPVRANNGLGGEDDTLAGRWGFRGKKGKSIQDNPLMSAFARLRHDLRGCKDIRSFDVPSLLHPFLQVIRSSSTSAPITSLALVSITKFFSYNLIGRNSPRLSLAMQLLSAAITHCRFEASDSAADEIVLLRILNLMQGMLSGPGGDLLGDESLCEMMETGLSMCCQIRLSELLRRSAEMAMVAMCQTVFERLKVLEAETDEDSDSLGMDRGDERGELKLDLTSNSTAVILSKEPQEQGTSSITPEDPTEKDTNLQETSSTSDVRRASESTEEAESNDISATTLELTQNSEVTPDNTGSIKPYSLPSIRELFRVLVDLLQPDSKQHGETLRVMALRIIDVALEVAGPSIAKHPSLASLAKNDLCRHLFQLVRSEHAGLLNESLRVAGTLLSTCRSALKLQQELYLSYLVACLHPRVEIPLEPGIDPALYEGVPRAPKLVKPPASQTSSGRSTPVPVKDRQKLGMEGGSRKPETREAMVESIGALARIPSFLVELYVNYDCEVDRSDLCEDLVGLLSRNAFPDSATWSTTNVPPLCLDSLLGYVEFIADRRDDEPRFKGYPDREKLREQRALKKIIIRGATKFNEHPKSGIAFLASQGVIDNPDDPHSVARFLRGTTRISKTILGEYLSKKSHEHLLEAFLDLFDFTGKRVDEALRDMLNSFRLPGESPLIERIVTVFSQKYSKNSDLEGIADKDAVLVLTYAIIMLNTDQHNPNVKDQKRMTYNDFSRNLRGVNGGKDFAPEYLQSIFDSIKTNEIILPDEHNNRQAFDYAWEELLLKTRAAGPLVICDTNIFDADMFEATWKPVIATLSYVFMSASDDAVFSRVVTGFEQCAQIAAKFQLTDALDHIVFCLSSISTLVSDTPANTSLNTEVQIGKQSVMVSELAVKLGRDFKAQLACVVLFGIISGNEAKIKNGWKHIVRIWLNLFLNSLIRLSFPQTQEAFGLSPIPLQTPSQVVDRGQHQAESGLFQSFTSYLSSYAADDPPEPSEEELDNTLCTMDCISACSMDDVFSGVLAMPTDSLKELVQALLEQLPQDLSPVVIVVKPERPGLRANGHQPKPQGLPYDPSMAFILEFVTILALRDQSTISAVGEAVVDAHQSVVRNTANVHSLVISRTVLYLLHLLNASQEHSFIRAPVILHTISGFDQSTLEQSASSIVNGLSLCIKDPGPLKNEITNTPDFWSILNNLHKIPDAAPSVFNIIDNIMDAKSPAVTADNYEAIVLLLNSFATSGGIGAVEDQRREKNRRAKVRQQSKPRGNEVVNRSIKAVNMVYQLTDRVPMLIEQSHLERDKAWMTYYSPIFQALRTQCFNPCRDIRYQSFSCLQRALLSPQLASPDHQQWTAIFSEVLFPLNARLLKPEVYQSDPAGMSESRVQAATLLCKIFLHYLVVLVEWEGMLALWLRILDVLDRLMNSGQGNSLEEAVPESLKNILLVMANAGYLSPPSADNPRGSLMWLETWKRVDRFLPGLFQEIFPDTEPPAPLSPVPTASASNTAATGGKVSVDVEREADVQSEERGAGDVEPGKEKEMEQA